MNFPSIVAGQIWYEHNYESKTQTKSERHGNPCNRKSFVLFIGWFPMQNTKTLLFGVGNHTNHKQ